MPESCPRPPVRVRPEKPRKRSHRGQRRQAARFAPRLLKGKNSLCRQSAAYVVDSTESLQNSIVFPQLSQSMGGCRILSGLPLRKKRQRAFLQPCSSLWYLTQASNSQAAHLWPHLWQKAHAEKELWRHVRLLDSKCRMALPGLHSLPEGHPGWLHCTTPAHENCQQASSHQIGGYQPQARIVKS